MPQASPVPEARRLEALEEYQILDTIPEEVYDRIVGLAAEICGTPIALFSLVDADRQWFKASHGLDAKETAREISFCTHAVDGDQLLVVEDAHRDERFAENELVLRGPKIRFYTGTPVRAHGGEPLGTLCVIDREPRKLQPDQLRILDELAREIEAHLEVRRSLQTLREVAEERAVQTAMVAHDAQNLMTVIQGALELATPADAESAEDLAHARGALERLVRMCENFLTVSAGERVLQEVRDDAVQQILVDIHRQRVGRGGAGELDPHGARGRGLGLAFCRTAIEKLGGELRLEPSESGGARFRIALARAS